MNEQQKRSLLETLKRTMQENIPLVLNEAVNTWEGIKKDTHEAYKEFCDAITANPQMKSYIVVKEVDLLTSQRLIEIAKSNIVENSNEAYVWKSQEKDATYVHVSYGKDKELIEKEHNKFIIIKVQALSTDVLNLFEESKLVILK